MFDMFTKAVCVANSRLEETALVWGFLPAPLFFLLNKWMDRRISKEKRKDFQDFTGQYNKKGKARNFLC